MKRLTLGMLAHVDSGKTTLCEELLYLSGKLKEKGRVDHGDSYLDNAVIEKKRGITVFSKQAVIECDGCELTILDTPGHIDFSAEMERILSVLDMAVLIIGANDGIMPHTKTLFGLLERRAIPTYIFVNKMDLAVKKDVEILEDFKRDLTEKAVLFSSRGEARPEEDIAYDVSAFDEELTDVLLNGADPSKVKNGISKAISERAVFPVYSGSALKGIGAGKLLKDIVRYSPDKYSMAADKAAAKGRVFKVTHDGKEILTHLKLEEGSIAPRDEIGPFYDKSAGEPVEKQKINEIRVYSGEKHIQKDRSFPGEVVTVTGLRGVRPGDTFGGLKPDIEELEPYMSFRVVTEDDKRQELIDALKILSTEDPKLALEVGRNTGDINLRLMGAVQTEVIKDIIRERFGIDCDLSESRIIYKETITGEVEGVGHFEPLRHYAEVHLIMTPNERGEGISVSSSAPQDELDRNWQNLIMQHITEREIRGVLIGAGLTDVNIDIAAGRASKKHTEGGDFREATWRALRQGLMTAREKGTAKVLEPWVDIEIVVSSSDVGKVMTELTNMGAKLEEPLQEGDDVKIKGYAPVSEISGYDRIVSGYSHGKARFQSVLRGYDLCHDEEKLVEKCGYEPERDTEYPADSVFCSKGSSDIVPWDQVYDKMHIGSVLELRKRKASTDIDPDGLLNEHALAEKRKREYMEKLATDKELMMIFERTYGPVKRAVRKSGYQDENVPEVSGDKGTGSGRTDFYKNRAKKGSRKDTGGTRHLFIDGYNLIHAWPELHELSETDFGSARDRTIDIICNYSAFMGYDTTLVFDAYKVEEGTGSELMIHGIKVVYTREHETADAYIEKVTHDIMKRKGNDQISVVSSDALVQQLSLGHGALRISSREFHEEVERVNDIIRSI